MRKLLVLLLLAPCALLAQVPDYVPTDGLLTWHNLDGNAVDQVGNHTGQLIGPSSTQNRYGEEGKALVFSDGDYVELGTYTEIQGLCEFSASIWYYGAESQGSGCCNMLWCSGFDQWLLNLGTWNPQLVFGGGLNCGAQGAATSDVNLYENWNHVVTVLKAGKASVWLNGQLKVEVNMSNCVCSHSSSMRLGTMDGYPHHFTGMMDDFGVWNRGLSETEISTLFIGTPPINGCTDPNSCNFDAEANLDDGSCYSCDIPAAHCGPGTHWDSTLAACVADVPGAEVAENCALMSLQELSQGYLNLLETVSLQDSLLNACQGDTASSGGSTDPATDPTAWSCGDPLAYQGYDYATVQIGDQCWFAENCRFLPSVSAPSNMGTLELDTVPRAFVYGNFSTSISEAATTAEYATYGAIYNWAATENWEICPNGWHIPADVEWQTLESNMGMSPSEVNDIGWQRGHEDAIGIELQTNGFQINSTGGFVHHTLGFLDENDQAFYWSSTLDVSNPSIPGPIFHRRFSGSQDGIYRNSDFNQNSGAYVRCLMD